VVVEIPAIEELKREYRLTYAEYVRQVDLVGRLELSGQPDSREMERAMAALERARRAHSAARDLLAEAQLSRAAGRAR
jgi:precorrin-3B methylase